jgi:WD40 repeat protein
VDGRLLVSSSFDNTVRVFDTRSKSNEEVSTLTTPPGGHTPTLAAFNPCGRTYVGVSTSNRSFLLYDIRSPSKLVQSYNNLTEGEKTKSVNAFAFHPSGDFAVTVGEDAKIKILDLIEGRPTVTLLGPRTTLNHVAFNNNG